MAYPRAGAGLPDSRPPRAMSSCSLTRFESGGQFGDQMPGLRLDDEVTEYELPRRRIDEELGRPGAAVAHGSAQPDGRVPQRMLADLIERRAGRLDDDRLIPLPEAAITDTDSPYRAEAIGHHLDFHTAQSRAGRHAGTFEGGPTRPRGHRNTDALSKLPGPYLVAKQANDSTTRAYERDALALAQPGKLRWVGDELPARPEGVGAHLRQRRQQPYRVQAGAVVTASAGECRRAEHHDLVGLPHDRRGGVPRVQGDGGYMFTGLPVQLRDRGHAAQSRFSTIDDGEPLHSRHVGSSVADSFKYRTMR